MRMTAPITRLCATALGAFAALMPSLGAAQGVVYRCPGPPVLYTDQITSQQAKDRNCRTVEGAAVTVVAPPPRPRPAVAPSGAPSSSPADSKVDRNEQRARDADARRILEAELKQEEERLKVLEREYNNGQPERRGDERNYERYQERVAGMKAAIDRKQSDLAAIRRELAKLNPAPPPTTPSSIDKGG
jgi:hypothetical protein